MLHVNVRQYADALQTCEQTPRRRLVRADFVQGQWGLRYWPLSVCLPTVAQKERARAPALVNAAVMLPAAPMPPNADAVAIRLIEWANARRRIIEPDSSWGKKIETVQRAFKQAIEPEFRCSVLAGQIDRLSRLVILDPAILKYVFADHPAPPDFPQFALEFALQHVRHTQPPQPKNFIKELYT